MKKVLFICTGNTCRSPMAEHLFKKLLRDVGRTDVEVQSAGVTPATWLEFPEESKKALEREGIREVRHKAQGMTKERIADSDLILTMEIHHKEAVVGRFPEAKDKTYVLKQFSGDLQTNSEIPDPYGQGLDVYLKTLDEIKTALLKVVKII